MVQNPFPPLKLKAPVYGAFLLIFKKIAQFKIRIFTLSLFFQMSGFVNHIK